MKKKNLIMMLVVGALVGTMLTGCGDKAEPTVETQTGVETVEEETTEAVEETATEEVETSEDKDLTMVTEEETTETTEEATEATEEVAEADFFAENGLTIVAPADVASFNGRFQGTDDVVTLDCTVEMTETSPTTTEFVWIVDGNIDESPNNVAEKFTYNWGLDIFDRASGVSFTSADYKTGDTATGEAFTVPLNDTETIDISYEFEQNNGENEIMTVKMTFVHPEGYNNAVFAIWGMGNKEQNAPDYNNLADALAGGKVPADTVYIAIQ